jgi:choline dehydrogenase-like flavoprotein
MGLYDRTIYAAAGVQQSAVCDEFAGINGGYGFWIECPPLSPGLAAAALQGFGAEHAALMRALPNVAPFIVLVRDGAGPDRSRGSVQSDRRGRISIRYSLGPAERATMREGLRCATRMHLEAGAREVRTLHTGVPPITSMQDAAHIELAPIAPNRISLFSAHLNGTCRMGTSPRTSGCTPDGERHGVPGIFIADGSALPTAPGVNPQATIMALASLVAERVRAICV